MTPLEELTVFIDSKTREVKENYTTEYINSKWYKDPSLQEVFSDTIAKDIEKLQKQLKSKEDTTSFVWEFGEKASEYGRSWYDEDLHAVRTGWEYETQVYTCLRNIAAKAANMPLKDWSEYYEGYTG